MSRRTIRFFVAVACLGLTTSAFAQSARTWISALGDDNNACSITLPCKTFSGALAKTTAAGEIDIVDNGPYGTVTINKSIVLNGEPGLASIIASGTNGIAISAGASDRIILRNLQINGTGSGTRGIRIISAGEVIIEHCSIWGFTERGISVENTSATKVTVVDSWIYGNFVTGGDGIVFSPVSSTVNGVLDNVKVDHIIGRGIYANNGTTLAVRNSIVAQSGSGVVVDQTAGTTAVTISQSTITNNGTGLRNGSGNPSTRLDNVTIEHNDIGVDFNAGVIASFGNNHISQNSANNGGGFTPVGQQ